MAAPGCGVWDLAGDRVMSGPRAALRAKGGDAAAAPGMTAGAPRQAAGLAVAVLCLLLAARISDVLFFGHSAQVPFTVALFVLPLLCALPGAWRLLARYRWPVLAVQAVLTWVPFALFGGGWQAGIDGLLAGLVLLMVASPVSWLLAALLLTAEVALRAAVTGLPISPAWFAVMWVVALYVDDALAFFGLVRLAQIVGEVEDARRQSADLAVARERLQAAGALHAAVGQRLADIAEKVAAARRALFVDAAPARAQIAAAGVAARDAVARARAMTAGKPALPGREPAAPRPARAAIGARVAWAVLVTTLLMYAVLAVADDVFFRYGARVTALTTGATVLIVALQLHHSGAARQGRKPRAWPVTLAVQAVLVYAFVLPFIWAEVNDLAPFLAGSILLLIPGRWRWAGYAAVVASVPVLFIVLPLQGRLLAVGQRPIPDALYLATVTAGVGLLVYGLSWLAGMAREIEDLHGELAHMAAVQERLRVARDVHDLLGLGLSAVALKTDLITALIGRDDARAAAEMAEMGRICATARADIRLVTGDGQRLSLAGELAAAERILTSAGIGVSTRIPGGRLPGVADEVLAPVLREAVTNILRHTTAAACVIEVMVGGQTLRLRVSNDGADQSSVAQAPVGDSASRGLANLSARAQAAGGRLSSRHDNGRFDLIAELPVSGPLGAC